MTRFQTEMEPDEPKNLGLEHPKTGSNFPKESSVARRSGSHGSSEMLTGRRYAAAPHIGNSTRYDMEPMETLKKDQTLGGGGGNQRRGKLAAQVAKQPNVSGSGRY